MSRLPLAGLLGATVSGALLASSLGACSTILGIDENLVQDNDAASLGGDDGSETAHGDAAVDGAAFGMGDSGDGDDPDGSASGDASAGAWHVDTDFADGGYRVLTTTGGVRPSGLQLLHVSSAAPSIVGISLQPSVVVYTASQSAPLLSFDANDSTFGGAIVLADGTIQALTVTANTQVTAYDFTTSSAPDAGYRAQVTDDVVFARLLDVSASQGVHSIGSVVTAGATLAANLYQQGTLLFGQPLDPAISSTMSLAKGALTTGDGTTYYAGICLEGCGDIPVAAYGSVADGGLASGGVVPLAAPSKGAGLTDLLEVDGGVYAVGFDDGAFVLATLAPDGTAAALGSIAANQEKGTTFIDENGPTLTSETELLGAFDGTRILVGGDFGGIQLAAFELDGGTASDAFSETSANGHTILPAVLDLADYLPSQATGSWHFQSMLLDGSYLYVTASSPTGDEGQWVVFRLVNSAVER